MATRNENLICSVLGTGAGFLLANSKAKRLNLSDSDKFKTQLWYSLLGGIAGLALSEIFGSANDTHNYRLVNRNDKTLYHGIAYEHRALPREKEHIKSGKKFYQMILDEAKPRIDALRIEKKLIKLDRPVYNIQHNN